MLKLIARQNRFDYRGMFTEPLFSLLDEDKKIVQGLYKSFSSYGVALADVRNDSPSFSPSDQVFTVNFSTSAYYKFKLDGIESSVLNFTTQDLSDIPKLLSSGDNWLRSTAPDVTFQSHIFATFSHNELAEGNSENLLLSLSNANTPDIGVNRGNGIIYHWDVPEYEWRVQLTIDHSVIVNGGLFVHSVLITTKDKIDYVETLDVGYKLFRKATAQIGLEVESEV